MSEVRILPGVLRRVGLHRLSEPTQSLMEAPTEVCGTPLLREVLRPSQYVRDPAAIEGRPGEGGVGDAGFR